MEVEDFIPDYPSRTDTEFNNKIFQIREFNELRTGTDDKHINVDGNLYNHQKLIARFMSPYTTYDSMLLYHTPGTGKTCAAIAVAEATLQNHMYGIDHVIILIPSRIIQKQWRNSITTICTNNKYYTKTDRTARSETIQITKAISAFYTIMTHGEFANKVSQLGDQAIVNNYSNKLFIVDEAHNLRIQSLNSKVKKDKVSTDFLKLTKADSVVQYNSFLRVFSLIRGCKKLLLTGTPMVDDANEIAGLFNLILPLKEHLPTGKEFDKKYLPVKDDQKEQKTNLEKLKKLLVGRVSYIREGGHAPIRIDQGETQFTKYIKTVLIKASRLQREGYKKAIKADKTDDKTDKTKIQSTLHLNKRETINFMYYDDTDKDADSKSALFKSQTPLDSDKLIWNLTAMQKLCDIPKQKDAYITYKISGKKKKDDIRNNLAEYSAYYAYVRDFLNEHPTEPTFIFNHMVSGTGGVEFMAAILEVCGFNRVLIDPHRLSADTTKKRFMVITGQSPFRNEAIEVFNSPKNRNGELIHTIIGTIAISEGVNFVNVKNILIRPYWNNSVIEQVIARGIRANSLSWVDKNDRKVNVYRILTYFDDFDTGSGSGSSDNLPIDILRDDNGVMTTNNIDILMYRMSERKDIRIKIVDRILKEVAFDCPLNYSRNVKQEFIDGSRDCEYTKCKYDCYQVVRPYSKSGPFKKSTGYYIEYTKPLVDSIKIKIRDYLQLHVFNTVDKIITDLGYKQDKKTFIATIIEMLNNNEIIPNRYGQPCFMCYKLGTLYLSPILSYHKDYYFLSYYAKYPFINTVTSLRTIVTDYLLNEDKAFFIDSNNNLKTKYITNLSLLGLDTKIFIVEYLMALAVKKPDIKNTPIYKYFEKRIFTLDSTTSFHTFNRVTECNIKYFDFEIGHEKGEYICFDHNTGLFTNCIENKKRAKEIVDLTMDKHIAKKMKETGINDVYGVDINCGFNIRDVDNTTSSNTGLKCRTGDWSSVKKLQDLVRRKGIPNMEQRKTTSDICNGIQEYLKDKNMVFEWLG